MLTPSHGKHIYTPAVITAIDGLTLYAQHVEMIQRDEQV